MDFEETRLYYSHQQLHQPLNSSGDGGGGEVTTTAPATVDEDNDDSQVPVQAVRRHFREFLRNYRLGGVSRYVYREKLLRMHRRLQRTLQFDNGNNESTTMSKAEMNNTISNNAKIEVDMAHIGEYDPTLLGYILNFPAKTIPCVESAAVDALSSLLYEVNTTANTNSETNNETNDDAMEDEYGEITNRPPQQQNADNDESNNPNSLDADAMLILRGLQIQVLLKGNMKATALRSIKSEHMNKLVRCPGIVISNSPVKARTVQLAVRCPKCNDFRRVVATEGPFSAVRLPRYCSNAMDADKPCGNYPFVTVPDESIFVDQQTLKLQEAPERVPTGEMPRSVLLAVERSLVDLAPPGTRVSLLCIPTLFSNASSASSSSKKGGHNSSKSVYLRVVGFQKENDAHGEAVTFTPAEEAAFTTLAKRSDVYDILCRSIAPNIQGSYTVDIKKALMCQLMSGSRKRLPDGVKLRGDINVLLLGDPSMAKSQFLKFVSKVAPIGIYTSGKGSSAAGLTASVIRDAKGEFYLEGGAMVLADGGIVCIDEFDKMRPNDRVAIHEAMEQQTISIAKAGITTVLNSRSSVLAAANPVYGRYDDFKSAADNIDLMSTILSRFDMIFLVRDIREEERDRLICQHIMGVHIANSAKNSSSNRVFGHTRGVTGAGNEDSGIMSSLLASSAVGNDEDPLNDINSNTNNASPEFIAEAVMKVATTGRGELDVASLKKYIQYCKAKCTPRLSEEAGEALTSSYVKIRDDIRKQGGDTTGTASSSDQPVIPITVRQLEALVRISESLAKMRIDSVVRSEDVNEALRLFKVSTMTASSIDNQNANNNNSVGVANTLYGTGGGDNTARDEIDRTESFVRSRLIIGNMLNRLKLIEEAVHQGFNAIMVAKAIQIMIGRGELLERNQGRLLKRIK